MSKIPKQIHYCWFGKNKKPEIFEKCLASWQKYCPDYIITEWNESNFPINEFEYAKDAYKARKWAFVSDVARMWVLNKHGGIYLDTDEEILKNLDQFLDCSSFTGFDTKNRIQVGIIGGTKQHWLFKQMLQYYSHHNFKRENNSLNMKTIVDIITELLLKEGLQQNNKKQTIQNIDVYPHEFFCPIHTTDKGFILSNYTYTVHHGTASWVNTSTKIMRTIKRTLFKILFKILGTHNYDRLRGLYKKTLKNH